MSTLQVKRLFDSAILPTKGSYFSAGHDLYTPIDITVGARGKIIIALGISVAIPTGYYGRIAPRSGLAAKKCIDIGAGVIDSDYRGEVGVVIFNHSDEEVIFEKGSRVAQLVIEKILICEVEEVEQLDVTERGEGGFGSTGV